MLSCWLGDIELPLDPLTSTKLPFSITRMAKFYRRTNIKHRVPSLRFTANFMHLCTKWVWVGWPTYFWDAFWSILCYSIPSLPWSSIKQITISIIKPEWMRCQRSAQGYCAILPGNHPHAKSFLPLATLGAVRSIARQSVLFVLES